MARTVGIKSPVGGSSSNPYPSGVSQGTPGGMGRTARIGVPQVNLGDEMYLWLLVLLEMGLLVFLRNHFRRHHGG